jgi:ABC-type amino acid transport substrate-binding protein
MPEIRGRSRALFHSVGLLESMTMKSRLVLTLMTLAAAPAAAQNDAALVCTHVNAGFFTRDAANTATGLEADILKSFAVARKMALKYEDLPSFDAVLKDTESGRCQIGVSTVTVTEARKSRFVFSSPYFPNRVVVVQKTSAGATQPKDLKGHRVAVVKGTLSVGFVAAIPGVKLVEVVDDASAFQALLKGEADALACDSAVVLHFLRQHPELGMAFPIGDRSFFAFILPKGSKLEESLNAHLKSLTKSPEFTGMLATHFGAGNAEFLAAEVAAAGTSR